MSFLQQPKPSASTENNAACLSVSVIAAAGGMLATFRPMSLGGIDRPAGSVE